MGWLSLLLRASRKLEKYQTFGLECICVQQKSFKSPLQFFGVDTHTIAGEKFCTCSFRSHEATESTLQFSECLRQLAWCSSKSLRPSSLTSKLGRNVIRQTDSSAQCPCSLEKRGFAFEKWSFWDGIGIEFWWLIELRGLFSLVKLHVFPHVDPCLWMSAF